MTEAAETGKRTDDLVSVKELGEQLGIAESTAWLVVRRLKLKRYRIPARRNTTLVSLSEARAAYFAPQAIEE